MSRRSGAGAVVRALEDAGIGFAFGIPGTHNIELWDRLAESERVTAIPVTDEQSASFMADGLWRASGQLGCVNVVPGAGLTHALSGIAEAWLDGVPMLVLGCGIRTDTGHSFQLHDVDQLAIAAPVTKGVFRPLRGDQLYESVRAACELALAPPAGPVMVEVPANLYLGIEQTDAERAENSGAHDGHEPVPAVPAPPPPAPEANREAIERAASILAGARRPMLYVGLGAAPAGPALTELAELLESPVFTTLSGKGVFPETHPLSVWPGGGAAAPPFARQVASSCDATLAIGCRFAEVGTGSYGFAPPRPLIHVDVDSRVLGRNLETDLPVTADSAGFVDSLLRELSNVLPGAEPDPALRHSIAAGLESALQDPAAAGETGIAPALLLSALQGRFPDASFATDSGNGTFLAAEGLRLSSPGRFLAPVDYSCMGYSVPAAIGAALGRPGQVSIALVGDGAFLMTGLEMLTAAIRRLPVLFVILRDRELAQIAQFQSTALNRRTGSRVPDYDLAAICSGAGVECLPLAENERIDEVLAAAATILAEPRPVTIDLAVDYTRKSWFTRGVVRTNFLRLPWSARVRFVVRALGRRLSGGDRTDLN
ncbi:MAG: thiamine pyrophosphate-binding protein [marine benthic group bacterium]|nr:thiamine pyrophosphate-binding protein [Gemmatimonadota bacterium]